MSFRQFIIFAMLGAFALPCYAEIQPVAATEPTVVEAPATNMALADFVSVTQRVDIRPALHRQWERSGQAILHGLAGDDVQAFLGFQPDIRFVASPAVHASVSGSGTLYLTEGILHQIHDPSEYAFILAHEVAHVLLGHHKHKGHAHIQTYLKNEIAADELALKLMSDAGYDSSAGHRFLTRIGDFGSDRGLPLLQLHPGLLPRIRALQRTELAFQ